MHTVAEVDGFRQAADAAGMTQGEIEDLVDYLSRNPMAGKEIKGTGGCRKLRVAGRGKGKSGGYRTITFYSGAHIPVYLITVFSKGERATLTDRECNALAVLTKRIRETYRRKLKSG